MCPNFMGKFTTPLIPIPYYTKKRLNTAPYAIGQVGVEPTSIIAKRPYVHTRSVVAWRLMCVARRLPEMKVLPSKK